jgi:hypothetical protein
LGPAGDKENDMGEATTIILAILALGGQLVNVYLNLRIRTAILVSEKTTLKQVGAEFVRVEVCTAYHGRAQRARACEMHNED